MTKLGTMIAGALLIASPALAQTAAPGAQPQPAPGAAVPGGAIVGDGNNTGGAVDVTVPRGATGADTAGSNSAASGNANQPERAVPQGSGGGGSR